MVGRPREEEWMPQHPPVVMAQEREEGSTGSSGAADKLWYTARQVSGLYGGRQDARRDARNEGRKELGTALEG